MRKVAVAKPVTKVEATAYADPENEAALVAALSALIRGKTVIVVAHRLATIRDSDQILVFDRGRLAEAGHHDDLMARGGTYARLWQGYEQAQHWALGEHGALLGLALALACIAPLFVAILSRPDPQTALGWLIATSLLMAATALRTRLGEQLRRMPLEKIQDKRAGELKATLLGNVDENLYYSLPILNLIFIAHRLSTIVAADQILVLDEGHLIERGRHAELLAAGGRYRAMWDAQQVVKSWRLGSQSTAPS